MISLEGHRVLVTGGSRGIGAACCRLFALAGATVCVHYHRRADAAAEVLGGLEPGAAGEHFSSEANLAEPADIDLLFEAIESRWQGLDCLVNNAGIWVHNPLSTFDHQKLEETWQVNLRAPILCAGRSLAMLRESEHGSIVNLSSTAGQRGEAEYGPYAASKGALIALTKSWATELAPTIRVNAVAPGWVDTDMSAGAYEGQGRDKIEASIPLGRVASAEDIAAPVVFLASPAARHITGEVLNVNGGSVLCG